MASVTLDLKDRKLLFELDQNCRQSLTKLGRKIGLSKNVVAYRLKCLEETGVIESYYPVIDASKLGYFSVRIYLFLQYVTPELSQEIKNYFIAQPNVWWCAYCEGSTDVALIIWVKDIDQFYNFWQETLANYGNHFKDQYVHLYNKLFHYYYEYLVHKKHKELAPLITGGTSSQIPLDAIDRTILQELHTDARKPIVAMAKNIGCSAIQVKHRMKKLLREGIIKGFRLNLNLGLLDTVFVKVDLRLRDHTHLPKILGYIQQNPRLVYVNKAIGLGDIEVEFHFDHVNQLHDAMTDIKKKFPGMIRYYTYFLVKKTTKKSTVPV